MPETSLTQDVVGGVRAAFDRVGQFLHLFDLAFFVAGVLALSAFAMLAWSIDRDVGLPTLPSWAWVLSAIVITYICGLLSFAVGRVLSSRYRQGTLQKTLVAALADHGIGSAPTIVEYLANQNSYRIWRLYIRMWQELVKDGAAGPTLAHISRYWAMAATYDAVAGALVIWALTAAVLTFLPVDRPLSTQFFLTLWIVTGMGATTAIWQGKKYFDYQIEDLVAWLACRRGPLL